MVLIDSLYRNLPILRQVYRPCRAAIAKRRLKSAVGRVQKAGGPLKIVIGANRKFQPGWIPTEIYTLNILKLEEWRSYFADNSIQMLLAEHVWEHLSPEDGIQAAKLCRRFLKPGGHLRVAVPDGFFPDARYIEFVRPGGTGPSADDHKVLYNYKSFKLAFESAGFDVALLEYFDEAGHFHENEWDLEDGKILRSKRFYNGHNFGDLKYRSLILDARK
jgi:predicted SAM-dependent methyltransferase